MPFNLTGNTQNPWLPRGLFPPSYPQLAGESSGGVTPGHIGMTPGAIQNPGTTDPTMGPGDTYTIGHIINSQPEVEHDPVANVDPDIPDIPPADPGVGDIVDPATDPATDFWDMWTGGGTYGHPHWGNIDPTIRSGLGSMLQGADLTADQWATVQSYLDRLNTVSLSGDQAAINQAAGDLNGFLQSAGITTTPPGEPADTGGNHPDQPPDSGAGGGSQGPGGEAGATQTFNTDFLYSADNAWLTQYTGNVTQVGADISKWYTSHSNISPEAAQATMNNFLRQVNEAIGSGDNEAALRIVDSLRSVSPTLASAIENYLGGPGEGFDTFTYKYNQYNFNPKTGELKVWDKGKGEWVVTNYTASPEAIDYYIHNVHNGPVDEIQTTPGSTGSDGEAGAAAMTRVRLEEGRGHGGGYNTIWSDSENRRVVPEFDFNPSTGMLNWDRSNVKPTSGGYPKGVIDMLIRAGWTSDQEGGAKNYKNWKWNKPYRKPQTPPGSITVKGPPPPPPPEEVNVRLVGNSGA